MTGSELPTTLTLTSGRSSTEVTLTAETLTTEAGQPAPALKLSPFSLWGRYVEATVAPETGAAATLDVGREFLVFGPVQRVTGAAAPARLTIEPAFGDPISVSVTEQSVVTVNNEPLEDLEELDDELAFVSYDPTSLRALSVSALGGFRRTRGRIESVDVDLAELVIRRSGGGSLFLLADLFPTIEDGSEAKILVDGAEATLADLRSGMEIVADWEEGEPPLAYILQARAQATESLTGTVTGSSLTQQTLVVRPAGSRGQARPVTEQLVRITPSTRITLKGKRVTLSRIPPGHKVSVTATRRGDISFARRVTVRTARR
ncbi:MAG: hypothetical protein ACK47B_27090 [Armatimonadota bacterium]